MNNIKKYNRCQVFYHFAPCQLTGLDEVLLLSAFDPQCKFFSKRLNETCRLRKFRTTYFKRSTVCISEEIYITSFRILKGLCFISA